MRLRKILYWHSEVNKSFSMKISPVELNTTGDLHIYKHVLHQCTKNCTDIFLTVDKADNL